MIQFKINFSYEFNSWKPLKCRVGKQVWAGDENIFVCKWKVNSIGLWDSNGELGANRHLLCDLWSSQYSHKNTLWYKYVFYHRGVNPLRQHVCGTWWVPSQKAQPFVKIMKKCPNVRSSFTNVLRYFAPWYLFMLLVFPVSSPFNNNLSKLFFLFIRRFRP